MASQHSTTADFSSRYKFNGKELDRETGWYYYGARYYDPQVSTWLSVDPLAEKYIGFSPYNYTADNPINLIDPDGRYFLGKNKKRADRIRRAAEKRKAKLARKADKLEKKGKNSNEVKELRERVKELTQTINDIDDMKNDDDVEYRYASASGNEAKELKIVGEPQTRSTGKNSKGHDIITMFTGSSTSQKIHETRHGGQHARGEVDAIKQNRSLDAEVSAFRAEFSWDGKLSYMIWNFDQNNVLSRKLLNNHMAVPGTIKTINSIFNININIVKEMGEFSTHPKYGTYVIPIYTNP